MTANKYIIVDGKFIHGKVEYNRDLLPTTYIRMYGGGRYYINEKDKTILVYSYSMQFGAPHKPHIVNALLKTDIPELRGYKALFSSEDYLSNAKEKNEEVIEMIPLVKIIRVEIEKVDLYFNDNLIGTLENDLELNEIQIQIAEQNLEGYRIRWNNIDITIYANGSLSNWPRGMYDGTQIRFAKLFNIRKEKALCKNN